MNLIDHYNSGQCNLHIEAAQRHESQWNQVFHPKPEERELPKYLIYMRSHFEKYYPSARVSIFAEQPESTLKQQVLIISIMHMQQKWRRFQIYNEVVIDPTAQSVLVKGSLLSNNQLLKMENHQQIVMALRKISNINPQLSPLRIVINPIEGTLQLINCSYVDAKFAILSNSQKNIEYFSMRVSFIMDMIIDQISILFYVADDSSLHQYYQGKFTQPFKKGNNLLTRLENTIYRASTHSQRTRFDCYHTKIAEMDKHHIEVDNCISNIFPIYGQNIEKLEYFKPEQLEKLSNQLYGSDPIVAGLASEVDQLIKFRIYSRIHLLTERPLWQDLQQYSGNSKIECASVRFTVVAKQSHPPIKRKKKGETDDDTFFLMRDLRQLPYVQAIITRKSLHGKKGEEKIENEKGLLQRLKEKWHPNIMTYFESESPQDRQFLYTLFEENQSLQLFIQRNMNLSFYQKLFMLEQAAKGLLFLHRSNIAHCDFKPANLIIGKKHLLKICDFGQSCFLTQDTIMRNRFGSTYPFAPPEFYTIPKEVGEKFDVYALGVTIYRCLFSEHIWGDLVSNQTQFLSQLRSRQLIPIILPQRFRHYPCRRIANMLVNLCLRCVSNLPEVRPSLLWVVTFLEQSRKCLEEFHFK